jgi:hypothetical protein
VTALAAAVDDRSRVVALVALAAGLEGDLPMGPFHRVAGRAIEVPMGPMVETLHLALAAGER